MPATPPLASRAAPRASVDLVRTVAPGLPGAEQRAHPSGNTRTCAVSLLDPAHAQQPGCPLHPDAWPGADHLDARAGCLDDPPRRLAWIESTSRSSRAVDSHTPVQHPLEVSAVEEETAPTIAFKRQEPPL